MLCRELETLEPTSLNRMSPSNTSTWKSENSVEDKKKKKRVKEPKGNGGNQGKTTYKTSSTKLIWTHGDQGNKPRAWNGPHQIETYNWMEKWTLAQKLCTSENKLQKKM